MEKLINIAPLANKEDKLQGIEEHLGELKDAFDAVNDVVLDEY